MREVPDILVRSYIVANLSKATKNENRFYFGSLFSVLCFAYCSSTLVLVDFALAQGSLFLRIIALRVYHVV